MKHLSRRTEFSSSESSSEKGSTGTTPVLLRSIPTADLRLVHQMTFMTVALCPFFALRFCPIILGSIPPTPLPGHHLCRSVTARTRHATDSTVSKEFHVDEGSKSMNASILRHAERVHGTGAVLMITTAGELIQMQGSLASVKMSIREYLLYVSPSCPSVLFAHHRNFENPAPLSSCSSVVSHIRYVLDDFILLSRPPKVFIVFVQFQLPTVWQVDGWLAASKSFQVG